MVRRIFAVIAFVVTIVLSASMSSASAGPVESDGAGTLGGCVGNICGSVMNESHYYVWAIRNWGDSSDKWHALAPDAETSRDQDWDGLYVACNASGRIAAWTPPGFWVWRDFTMSRGAILKISTYEDAHVRSQSC